MRTAMLGGHTDCGIEGYAHGIASLNGIQLAQRPSMTFEAWTTWPDTLAAFRTQKPDLVLQHFSGHHLSKQRQREQTSNDRINASAV